MITISELQRRTQSQKRTGKVVGQELGYVWLGYVWHRNLSIYLTYVLVRWLPWCTANMVSFAMITTALYAAWLVSSPDTYWQLIGLGLFYLSFLLDKVDGELARYYEQYTFRGTYLDEWYHVVASVGILIGMFAWPAYTHSFAMTLVLLLAVAVTVVRRFERKWYLMTASKARTRIESGEIQSQSTSRLVEWIVRNPLLKVAAVVERFDLVVLTLVVMVGFNHFTSIVVVEPVLWLIGYTVVSLVYTARFAIWNYGGRFDAQIRGFVRNGFGG